RRREPQTRFELMGSGSSWLGPDWRLARTVAASSSPRTGSWDSSSAADLIGGKALPGSLLKTEFGLPAGVTAEPIPGCRGLLLRTARSRPTAQVLPVALPAAPYETDRGQLCVLDDHSHLTLSCMARGGRCWLPLLVSWDPRRHRKRLSWRVLTVAQDSKVCAHDVAFAVRVSWGRDDTLVIYRSLGPPAPRSFLGHQTKARFLLGRFTSEGNVEPLLSVD